MKILQKTYWNFVLAFQKILEMFDDLMKLTNFDKYVQFIKIQARGCFWKNLKETLKIVDKNFRNFCN